MKIRVTTTIGVVAVCAMFGFMVKSCSDIVIKEEEAKQETIRFQIESC